MQLKEGDRQFLPYLHIGNHTLFQMHIVLFEIYMTYYFKFGFNVLTLLHRPSELREVR